MKSQRDDDANFFFTAPIIKLGNIGIDILNELGRIGIFLYLASIHMFSMPIQLSKIIEQIYFIGRKSVFVICLTGFFTGMVLGLQGYYALVQFGAVGKLGSGVALTLVREMGPVLSAIMVVARAGSAISAEIGIMRISEQIDALETMEINPIRFLVSPKLVASILSFPILTTIFDFMGIFGGYVSGVKLLGVNAGIYLFRVQDSVLMSDVTGGYIKSVVFAVIVSIICCYQGYYTHIRKEGFGAKGVSNSTTSAVVQSCIIILVSDYVITSFLM